MLKPKFDKEVAKEKPSKKESNTEKKKRKEVETSFITPHS